MSFQQETEGRDEITRVRKKVIPLATKLGIESNPPRKAVVKPDADEILTAALLLNTPSLAPPRVFTDQHQDERLPQSKPRIRNLCLVLNAPFFPRVAEYTNADRPCQAFSQAPQLSFFPYRSRKNKKALLSPIHFSQLKRSRAHITLPRANGQDKSTNSVFISMLTQCCETNGEDWSRR